MLMRYSWVNSDFAREYMEKMTLALHEALKDDDTRPLEGYSAWHPTRRAEYPWVFTKAPPTGKILDIGSDTQCHCAMLGMGVQDITFHKTFMDANNTGRVFPYENNGQGGIWTTNCYEKYKHNLKGIWGNPEDLGWVPDGMFDVVYNISVMEHVEADQFGYWMDFMWRMCKPGGRIGITCDWYIDFPVSDGVQRWIMNHDLSPWFQKWGVMPEQPLSEIPWSEEFNPDIFDDKDIFITVCQHRLAVYGMTFTKPLDA